MTKSTKSNIWQMAETVPKIPMPVSKCVGMRAPSYRAEYLIFCGKIAMFVQTTNTVIKNMIYTNTWEGLTWKPFESVFKLEATVKTIPKTTINKNDITLTERVDKVSSMYLSSPPFDSGWMISLLGTERPCLLVRSLKLQTLNIPPSSDTSSGLRGLMRGDLTW